ncbi:MAG: hemerythrin domain-containing protein [Chloroflexi bacterium]|nr:hemerythrin domain-containing protein [Chloroflexota bacterium]
MNPIEHLLEDHRLIMAQVADLRRATADLGARGEAALADALPVLGRIGHMMETQLALHAKKEDEALFPALEAVFGEQGGPTGVMRIEHKEIHGQGEILRKTLHELHQVEHPQIEAGAEKLKALAVTGGSADMLKVNAEEIIRLLDMHFGKEEDILFPMALNMLDDEGLAEVGQKIEAMLA